MAAVPELSELEARYEDDANESSEDSALPAFRPGPAADEAAATVTAAAPPAGAAEAPEDLSDDDYDSEEDDRLITALDLHDGEFAVC